ncbi:MAG: GTP 3',8-cyclase MoaA [Acidobacteria bacterium]|nr:GTP 3',8-cyclase MoaA [Acidobacteriota bacterium]
MRVVDAFVRPLTSLRLSVTDRCNLRCHYCMPEADYVWLPRKSILTFEETSRLVEAFTGLGVDRVRLTGGEPLLRQDLPALIELLAANRRVRDLALTTNAILLRDQVKALRAAGLRRITVSLDSLHPDRFEKLTRFDSHPAVLAGIDAALDADFESVKLDAVIIRDVNGDELPDLLEFGRHRGIEVRFIEYMDVGGATQWSTEAVVSRREMLEILTDRYGPITPVDERTSAPADRFTLPDGTIFGIISSTTEPFCQNCDRSRLTADGLWYLCLYGEHGVDLRQPLRAGASGDELREQIAAVWRARTDRGAEARLGTDRRVPFIPIRRLKEEPHLEMHTRGG